MDVLLFNNAAFILSVEEYYGTRTRQRVYFIDGEELTVLVGVLLRAHMMRRGERVPLFRSIPAQQLEPAGTDV